jgi:hypothetical protein
MNKILISIIISIILITGFVFKVGYDGVVSLEEKTLGDKIGDLLSEDFKDFLKKYIFFVAKYKQDIIGLNKEISKYKRIIRKNNEIIYNELGHINFELITVRQIDNNDEFNIRVTGTNNLFNGKNPYALASGYLDLYDDKIFLASADGNFFYNDANVLKEKKYKLNIIQSNIKKIVDNDKLNQQNFFGIKDIHIQNSKIFVSYVKEFKKDCFNLEVVSSNLNLNFLEFTKIFGFDECAKNKADISHSGGRLVKLDDENIFLTIGDFNQRESVQNKNSFFGKIIKINLKDYDTEIISKGHRNPQGLFFLENKGILLSTEHGPIGGDEINLININQLGSKNYNFGWPIASYGIGNQADPTLILSQDIKYEDHKAKGFDEPLTYFTPSIGISQLVAKEIDVNKNIIEIIISALGTATWEGDKSIHLIKYDLVQKKILDNKVLNVHERIRDLVYDKHNDRIYLFLESDNWYEGANIASINLTN